MRELRYKVGDLVNHCAVEGRHKPAIICSIDYDSAGTTTVGLYHIDDKTYTIEIGVRASEAIEYISTPSLEWQQMINVWRTTELLKKLQEMNK